jgi:tetratricopeptide (TPR) repeat protein
MIGRHFSLHQVPSPLRLGGPPCVAAFFWLLLAFCWPAASWSAAAEAPAYAPAYTGTSRCVSCHAEQARLWQGSHHDLAMTEAGPETVLGDFADAEFSAHGVRSRFFRRDGGYFVRTDGPDGALVDYPIRYSFGWFPLQQYLIEFPGGRLQALGIAWDSRPAGEGGQRWFHLYPDEPMNHRHPLHWTGREQNWNFQCAECHSTGVRRNYDPGTDSYRTTWAELDVACEACHGPGAAHLAWAKKGAEKGSEKEPEKGDKGLSVPLGRYAATAWSSDPIGGPPRRVAPPSLTQRDAEVETCALCHARRGAIRDGFRYGRPLADSHVPALLEEALYFPDGQIKDEVFEYGSFLQSRMYHAGVRCSDCHDPHSLRPRAEGDAVCTRCHAPGRYATAAHHHHPEGAASCAACHMPQRTYMRIDQRADHSLRIPRPDLSLSLGSPNPCTGCHRERDDQWAADALRTWRGGTEAPPHHGEALQAGRRGTADAPARLLGLIEDASRPAIVRATAIDLLARQPLTGLPPSLPAQLEDPDPLVRAAAVRWFGQGGLELRAQHLVPRLEDPLLGVRLEAARALAPLAPMPLPERLRDSLGRVLAEYQQAMRATAERAESNHNLGLVFADQGRRPEAEAAYRRALALDPGFTPAYVNLADLYRQIGREAGGEAFREIGGEDKGVALLREGLQHQPLAAELHHALGLALVRAKQPGLARESLARAAELAPDNPRYAYIHAIALAEAGDQAAALAVLRAALERSPGDPALRGAVRELSRRSANE